MKSRFARTVLSVVACLVVGAPTAFAQATRTWVSGVGDDANPCSRTAPCKTFAGAISKTATGGEISVLDPGGYGTLTVTKSITISGVGTQASILGAGTNGINISAPAGAVITLRHLQINGAGTGLKGINFLAGGVLVVEDVRVFGFQTGIETAVGNTMISDATFHNNSQFGVHAKGGTLTIENSLLTANGVAVQATAPATVRLSNNGIYNNLTGFGCGGGTLASAGNNRKAGNVGGVGPACSPTVAVTLQ
jgi:hypothetical protein